MQKNVNLTDKIVRILLAAILGILVFTNQLTGTLAVVSGIFVVILLLTSITGFCPIYALLNLSTLKKSVK